MTVEQTLTNLLDSIKDPNLGLTAKEMGLKYKFTEAADQIQIQVNAGFPAHLLEQEFKREALNRLTQEYPQQKMTLHIGQFIKAHKTQLVGKGLRGVKNTIAIASGKGGVGKSTVAVNLAIALARQGARVGILDADIYGPSLPLMLGQAAPPQLQGDFYLPVLSHGIQAMSMGYLTQGDQALIWRGPMLAKALIQMLDITLWDELDYLFIDLPPGTGDIQLTLAQKIPLTAAIVVTTPQNVATLDAQKAITMFSKTGIDLLGIIENMSTYQCTACGHKEAIFGSNGAENLCHAHHCLLLGQLPLNGRIRQHCDAGSPTAMQEDELSGVFIKTAMRSVIELAKRPINYANKFPDVVVE